MEKTMIEMKNVHKRRGVTEIGPLSFSLPLGHILALVGHNGSGKSTLLHMLTRIIRQDAGEIYWCGQSYEHELPTDVRQWIGYMPEHFTRDEDRLTARQAAAFRAQWYTGWDELRFQELMDRFQAPWDKRLSKVSKGERRKFELAAALAPHPRLLLLDEPSSGLDPFSWKIMIDELKDCMRNERTTIILSSHIIDEVRRLADYVALMDKGQMLGVAEKDRLLETGKEIWFEGSKEDAGDLPGVVEHTQEGMLQRVVTMKAPAVAEMLEEAGIRILRSRALELDELMTHWMAGQLPEDILMDKGVI